MKLLNSLRDVSALKVSPNRLHSATHDEIKSGATTDIYFINTRDVLNSVGKLDTPVVAEIFTRTTGMFAGLDEVLELLRDAPVKIDAIPEGEYFSPKEVLVRITGPYGAFGYHETDILGILSSSCAWATAARECVEAAEGKPVLSFGARHLHPAISPVMESIAVKFGGCAGASCVLGAKLAGG
ncbi:MAG: nicotinate phosphoribosyltransferase, partial [Synergistaceae bacterium]|nr:nicotinate phosphoribosyltransferase [Synergistaceae bacterium]